MRVERASGAKKVTWWTMLGLLLIPLIVAGGLFLTSQPAHASVKAALVNEDQMVTIDGQLVPLGRQLSADIIDQEDNIEWVLADLEHAEAGLVSGEYAAVVRIPSNFSAAATSYADNDAAGLEQATIEIQVSENSPVTDAALAQQIAQIGADSLNATLTETYLDNIYLGFNTMGDQFTTMVDGAKQLAEGSNSLTEGLTDATEGAEQLDDGLADLANSTPELVAGVQTLSSEGATLLDGVGAYTDGTTQLVDGLGQLEEGLNSFKSQVRNTEADYSALTELSDGAKGVADGAKSLANGLDDLAEGASPLADGAEELSSGASELSQGASQLATGAQGVATGAAGLSAGIDQVVSELNTATAPTALADQAYDGCMAQPGADDAVCSQVRAAFEAGYSAGTQTGVGYLTTPDATNMSIQGAASQLAQGAGEFAPGVEAVAEGAAEIEGGASALSSGATQVSDGIAQSAAGADSLASGAKQLKQGVATLAKELPKQTAAQQSELADGIGEVADAVETMSDSSEALVTNGAELSSGAQQFKVGLQTLAAEVEPLVEGTQQLADGSAALTEGLGQAADGSSELTDGINTFAEGLAEGKEQVPYYSAEDRAALAKVVSRPIENDGVVVSAESGNLLAVLLSIGLWLGAMATYLVLRAIPSRVLTSSRPTWQLLGAALTPGLVLSAAAATALSVLGIVWLGLPFPTGIGLWAFLMLAGLTFAAVNQAVTAWFGGWGRIVLLGLAVFAVGVGLSSGMPSWVASLAALSPVMPGIEGVRAIVAGAAITNMVGTLLIWFLLALLAGYVAIARHRQLTVAQFQARTT